ncbi:hypothetical protein T484DRAFT_1948747, partial [Baffinella frigidus]
MASCEVWPQLQSPRPRPKEEREGSYRGENRGVPGIHREGLPVGRGWGRQEIGCTHGLSCSVPCDHDDFDKMKGVRQVRVDRNS